MTARRRTFREPDGLREIRRHVPGTIARGLAALHQRNARLWDLEDRVRGMEVATTIARLKRAIDVAKLARHAAVKQIDAAVLDRYKRGRHPAGRGAVIDSS